MQEIPFPLSWFLMAVVVVAAITDFKWQRIPNALTFPTMLLGLVGHGLAHGWEGVGYSLSGFGLGLILLFMFYALGGMAAGDVKLLGAVGAILGPANTFLVFVITALLGGLYAIVMMMREFGLKGMAGRLGLIFSTLLMTRSLHTAFENKTQAHVKLKYGIVIALGTLTLFVWKWGRFI